MAGARPPARRSVRGNGVCRSEQLPPSPSGGISGQRAGAEPAAEPRAGAHADVLLTRQPVLKSSFNLQHGLCQQHAHTHLKMAEPNFFFKGKLM